MANAHEPTEDLDENPFYQTLSSAPALAEAFKRVQDGGGMVCIPSTLALSQAGLPLDQPVPAALVAAHIFLPSPFFSGEFESLPPPAAASGSGRRRRRGTNDSGSSASAAAVAAAAVTAPNGKCTVHLPEGAKEVRARSGYAHNTTARILFEEQSYNAAFEPYRVLCIDAVLGLPPAVGASAGASAVAPVLRGPPVTFSDHMTFLTQHTDPEALLSINLLVRDFNSTYLAVKGYLDDLVAKVAALQEECLRLASEHAQPGPLSGGEARFQAHLRAAVECFVLDHIHGKLAPALDAELADSLARPLRRRLRAARSLTLSALDVRPEFDADFTECREHLTRLPSLRTPLEKLQALKDALDAITTAIEHRFKLTAAAAAASGDAARTARACAASLAVTADELIPLLAYAIWQGKIDSLPTQLRFVEAGVGVGVQTIGCGNF